MRAASHRSARPRRRAALAGLAALGLTAPKGPDAKLIRLCEVHVANMDAYNTTPRDEGSAEDKSLWAAYERTRDAISAAKPRTLEGVRAKARAAQAEADGLHGDEEPCREPCDQWAWDLVQDVLRLSAGATVGPTPTLA